MPLIYISISVLALLTLECYVSTGLDFRFGIFIRGIKFAAVIPCTLPILGRQCLVTETRYRVFWYTYSLMPKDSQEAIHPASGYCHGKNRTMFYGSGGASGENKMHWPAMLQELASSGRLIWLLILRDISVRYRQSVLGILWALIPQVVTVGAFTILNAWRVIPMGRTAVPYVIYAAWGMSLWQLFANSLLACTTSLTTAGSLVTKVNFPRECLIVAAVGQPLFDFLIRLLPIVAIAAWYGIKPSWSIVFMPIVICPFILLAIGIGFALSIANVVLRDVGGAMGTTLTLGMFLTPVLYPPPSIWPYTLINTVNPLSPLFSATQELIAIGRIAEPAHFIASYVFAGTVFAVGWRGFRVAILRVATYL